MYHTKMLTCKTKKKKYLAADHIVKFLKSFNSLRAGYFLIILLSSSDFFFSKNFFQEKSQECQTLDPVRTDVLLSPDCLQRLSADDKSHR